MTHTRVSRSIINFYACENFKILIIAFLRVLLRFLKETIFDLGYMSCECSNFKLEFSIKIIDTF